MQQALIAVGAGGMYGEGYGYGTQTQLRFLKETAVTTCLI
ncbi:MAG: hypothetical protein ACKOBL_02255 [Chloroflexota bacterium]